MSGPLFLSLDPARLAREIAAAERTVCYAAPGIFPKPAAVLARLAGTLGPERIAVCLDFNEHVIRMGFGTLKAVQTLRDAGIEVRSAPGLRTGLIVIDDRGYVFTPTALYFEADQGSGMAPTAMRLPKDQATEALARLSPATKAIAVALAATEDERERIRERTLEVRSERIRDPHFEAVEQRLEEAPPLAPATRQVRVFSAYLQHVEMRLTGIAIQRHRLAIPLRIRELDRGNLEGRLKTTFNLIKKNREFSSKRLEDRLDGIRNTCTFYLGEDYGRVVLSPHIS